MFLSAVMLLLAVVAFAQSGTKDNPLAAHPGTNTCSHPAGEAYHSCWWSYTSNRDGVFFVTPPNSDTFVYAYDATGDNLLNGADMPGSGKAYLVKSGETIYIEAKGEGQISFEGEYMMQSGSGLDENDPLWLADGAKVFMGDPSAASMTTSYAKYSATGDGVLVLNTKTYILYCSVNGGTETSFASDSERGGYSYKVNVKSGETYNIAIRCFNPFVITPSMVNPEKGSVDAPFEMSYGKNTVPAAAGTYYYTFSNPNGWGGNAAITSDAALPEGQVRVYRSLSNINYDIVYAQSETGSFNVSFETAVYVDQTTYYIVVDKKTATDADGEFDFSWERYAEGSDKDNPHVMAQFPYTAVTETAFNPVWYAVDVPAGTAWNITIRATGTVVNPETKVKIYQPGYDYSRYAEGMSGATYAANGGESGCRYLVFWDSKETEGIPFEVSYEEVSDGDIIGKPIIPVLGENVIANKGTGTKYYKYTATRGGKLAVEVSNSNMNVTFPKGVGQYEGVWPLIKNGNSYYITETEGTDYYIKVENIEDGDKFILTESDFAAGEDRATAIDVPDGIYTINAPKSNFWVKYTVKKTGKLNIGTTMTGNGCAAAYSKNSDSWTIDMKTNGFDDSGIPTTVFKAEISVVEGDVYFVCFSAPESADGKLIKFTERDFELGEDWSTAIPVTMGEFHIPEGTAAAPVWCKATLKPGNFKMVSKLRAFGLWYTSRENAKNGIGERLQMQRPQYDFIIEYDIAEEGEYYIKFDETQGPTDFEVTGDALVDEVIPYPHRKMYGFYLRNNAVDGYGLYSMWMDDLANAEPIYRYDSANSSVGAYCGAVVDDVWYGVNYVYSMSGPPLPGGFVGINIKTGKQTYIGEWAGQDEDGLRFQDMTYDYNTKTMYAVGFNAGESALYTFDLTTGKPTRVIDFGVEEYGVKRPTTLGTLACDLEGNLYGMQSGNGILYSVDKETGILTPVFESGLTQMPGNQSMEFDRTTGLLYWSSCTYSKDEAKDTWLVVFDLKNNKMYCDENSKMGLDASCEGLYIPFVAAGSKAAAAPSDFKIEAGADGAKIARLTWVTPEKTFDGRNFISSIPELTITRNGEVIKTYTSVETGVAMNFIDENVPADGLYKYAVYATTEVGEGENATEYIYVGIDSPNEVAGLNTAPEPGCAAVSLEWQAPVGGAHGGWFDAASIRYRVTRYPDKVVVAENIDKPKFTDDTMRRLARYYYGVTAYNEMGESQRVLGDYIIAGPAKTPPVTETLYDTEAFQNTWTMADGNNDLYTWYIHTGLDAYQFGTGIMSLEYIINPTYTPPTIINDADEWVITPPINFEAGKKYRIAFQTRNITTETLEIHTGVSNAVADMNKCEDLTLEATPENFDGTVDPITNIVSLPQMDGINCVGIRLTSPIPELLDPSNPYSRKQAYFQITNFSITEDTGTGVGSVNVGGEDITISMGENGININGEFDKAVLYDTAGRMLETVTNGTVSAKSLEGKVGVLVVTQGSTTKVFKIKM